MTDDPPRLKDTDGPGRALLRRAGRVPTMDRADRAAILGALGAASGGGGDGAEGGGPEGGGSSAGGGSGGAGSAASSPVVAALKTPFALALAGAVVAGVAVVAMRAASAPPPAEPPPPATSLAAPPTSALVPPPPVPRPAEEPAPSEEEPGAARDLPEAPPAAPAVLKRARGAASASPAAEDTLAAESALVGRARATLDASPGEALALLEDHARRFPRGELAAERDFLKIKALRRLGRADEARQHARTYATKHPSSPYAPAARTILGELGGP